MENRKMGQILVDTGVIDDRQLAIALAEQQRTGDRLGRILTKLGLTTEDAISQALATQTGVDHCDLEKTELQSEAAQLIPEQVARKYQLVPIAINDGTLLVAMANPTDIVAIDELERSADLFVHVVSASRRQVMRAIHRIYSKRSRGETSLDRAIRNAADDALLDSEDALGAATVELVEEVLRWALQQDATDLHFEPDHNVVRVRIRVDGGLVLGPTLPGRLLPAIAARIKVLSDLNIAETRLPQDGKIRFAVETRTVDLRVSTFPTVNGESIVLRILDSGATQHSLDSIGLEQSDRDLLEAAICAPNGLILAAGPTGSGKTTTLFALMRSIDSAARKVITLEDPVEYRLPLVTQCQVNEKAGLTFAAGLRSILRHDPDVVLVGEMRDPETAGMALQAALTGHLVLSTIHTNDAVRTVSRLRDMGAEPFLIASCLSAVVAQRLVRTLCEACREAYQPTPQELEAVGVSPELTGRFARGRGCDRCNRTGNRGREAIFEVLQLTPELNGLIGRDAPLEEVEAIARKNMRSFRDAIIAKARRGRVAIAEIARVSAEA